MERNIDLTRFTESLWRCARGNRQIAYLERNLTGMTYRRPAAPPARLMASPLAVGKHPPKI